MKYNIKSFTGLSLSSGFTLVEVLVALAILSSALIPISGILSSNRTRTRGIELRNHALNIIDTRMTTLKNSSFKIIRNFLFPDFYKKRDSGIGVIKKSFNSLNLPSALQKKLFFDLNDIDYNGFIYKLELQAEIFNPTYSFKAYRDKAYIKASKVKGTRSIIKFRLSVKWKSARNGKERVIDACYLKTPAA